MEGASTRDHWDPSRAAIGQQTHGTAPLNHASRSGTARKVRINRAMPCRWSSTQRPSNWPVTPEVAGSSPVAPVCLLCKQACCVARVGSNHAVSGSKRAAPSSEAQTENSCKTPIAVRSLHPCAGGFPAESLFRQRDLRRGRATPVSAGRPSRLKALRTSRMPGDATVQTGSTTEPSPMFDGFRSTVGDRPPRWHGGVERWRNEESPYIGAPVTGLCCPSAARDPSR
jgi:hypothetical protein